MLPLKRLFFVIAAFITIVFCAAVLVLELVPFLIYYIISGKYFGLSEKLQSLTFEYIEKKIDASAK
jgi:hypothetical protein